MRNLYFILLTVILFSTATAQTSQIHPPSAKLIPADVSIPPDLIDLNNSAVNKGLKGNFKEAAADFRKIIQQAPYLYQVKYNLGRCLVELEEFDEAIRLLTGLDKLNLNHADTIASLGEAYYLKGMYKESIPYFRRAIELAPNDAVLYNNLGNALYRTNELEESLKCFNTSIKLQTDANTYNNRGAVLYAMGNKKEAIADFRKSISLKPDFAQPYNNLGVILGLIGKDKEAHQAFLEAVRLRPDWANAMYNLAISYLKRNERDLARVQLDKLSTYDSDLAEKGRKLMWQKYVVNASSFKEN